MISDEFSHHPIAISGGDVHVRDSSLSSRLDSSGSRPGQFLGPFQSQHFIGSTELFVHHTPIPPNPPFHG